MDDPKSIPLDIEISANDATKEEIERMTRQLLAELRELDVESAKLALGTIAVKVLLPVLPSVISLVQAWATRGQGRTVKFKGKGIEFEGSPEDLEKLLKKLESRRPPGDPTTDAPPPPPQPKGK